MLYTGEVEGLPARKNYCAVHPKLVTARNRPQSTDNGSSARDTEAMSRMTSRKSYRVRHQRHRSDITLGLCDVLPNDGINYKRLTGSPESG